MWKLVAAALVVALGAGTAPAQIPVPSLRAEREHDGAVRVRWSWSADVDRGDVAIEIERGTPFAAAATVRRPRRRGNWLDGTPADDRAAYRARLVVAGAPSAWSAVATASPAEVPSEEPDEPEEPPVSGPCSRAELGEVLDLVNDARRRVGAPALETDPRLAAAAAQRSADIAARGNLTHDGWIATIRASGYTSAYLGENIAMGYGTAPQVVGAWMASEGHRANLLSARFSDSGVGCTLDRSGRPWWAHDFGG